MVYVIIKKTEREIRERAYESRTPGFRQGGNIDGYARGLEEADEIQRTRGRDNPNQRPILVDDGGQAETELRHRTLRAHGINPESFDARYGA